MKSAVKSGNIDLALKSFFNRRFLSCWNCIDDLNYLFLRDLLLGVRRWIERLNGFLNPFAYEVESRLIAAERHFWWG